MLERFTGRATPCPCWNAGGEGACRSNGMLCSQTFCMLESSEVLVSLLSPGFNARVVPCLVLGALRAKADFPSMVGFVCDYEQKLDRSVVWTNALQKYLASDGLSGCQFTMRIWQGTGGPTVTSLADMPLCSLTCGLSARRSTLHCSPCHPSGVSLIHRSFRIHLDQFCEGKCVLRTTLLGHLTLVSTPHDSAS